MNWLISPKENPFMATRPRTYLSIDAWAVALSLSLALIIRLGLIKTIPW